MRAESEKSQAESKKTSEKQTSQEVLVPANFKGSTKNLMRTDSSPDRFVPDQSQLDSVKFDMRVGMEKQ